MPRTQKHSLLEGTMAIVCLGRLLERSYVVGLLMSLLPFKQSLLLFIIIYGYNLA